MQALAKTDRVADINRIYVPLYDLQKRYIVLYGSRRSGKSVFVSQALARRALEHRNRNIVVLRKYATTIRLSTWPRMLDAISEITDISKCYINRSDRIIGLPNGSTFNFVGADDPEKLKSIENVTDYWLEEATEFDRGDFDVLDAGMSTVCDPQPQIWMSFNPVPNIPGYQVWVQQRFLNIEHELGQLVVGDNFAVMRTYYKHNAFCPDATKRVLEAYRETNPDLWKMWGLGEFTTFHGAILKNWGVVKEVPAGIPLVGYGLDFGYAEDPAAVIKVWKHHNHVWLQEKVYNTGLTNEQLSEAMELVGLRKKYDDLIGDNAEPKTIQELKDLGWTIRPSEKGRDYKRAAALYLQGLHIHVLEDSPNLQTECATWSWKVDPKSLDGDGRARVLPIVADGNDHGIDATIYRLFRPRGTLSEGEIAASHKKNGYTPIVPESTLSDKVEPLALED